MLTPIPAQAPWDKPVEFGIEVSPLVPLQTKLLITPLRCCDISFEQLKSFHASIVTVPLASVKAGKIFGPCDLHGHESDCTHMIKAQRWSPCLKEKLTYLYLHASGYRGLISTQVLPATRWQYYPTYKNSRLQ